MNALQSQCTVADLHCHYYPCFDPSKYFEFANLNLLRPDNSNKDERTDSPLRYLFLADLQWSNPNTPFKLLDHLDCTRVVKNNEENNNVLKLPWHSMKKNTPSVFMKKNPLIFLPQLELAMILTSSFSSQWKI